MKCPVLHSPRCILMVVCNVPWWPDPALEAEQDRVIYGRKMHHSTTTSSTNVAWVPFEKEQ